MINLFKWLAPLAVLAGFAGWSGAENKKADAWWAEQRVLGAAQAQKAEESVISRTPTPAGDLLVVRQGEHHYAILQNYKGNQMTHHPDCPCGKLEKP